MKFYINSFLNIYFMKNKMQTCHKVSGKRIKPLKVSMVVQNFNEECHFKMINSYLKLRNFLIKRNRLN